MINSNNMNDNLGDQPHLEVKSIVWNKSLGLVQYELNHNIIYTIKMSSVKCVDAFRTALTEEP